MNSYGTLKLTETSPAQSFTEPVSLLDAKTFLRAPIDVTDQDYMLDLFISGAREQAEILQGRDLVQKQYDLSLDCFHECEIRLRPQLSSVDLAQYTDSDGVKTTMAENTDYIVDTAKNPGIVLPPYGQSWPIFTPWPSSAVLIRFTSGFSVDSSWWNDAGKRVKVGMLLLISAWYNNALPFEIGPNAVQEYPYTVTSCLSYGREERCA